MEQKIKYRQDLAIPVEVVGSIFFYNTFGQRIEVPISSKATLVMIYDDELSKIVWEGHYLLVSPKKYRRI